MATMDDLSGVVKDYVRPVQLDLHIYTKSSWAQPKKDKPKTAMASAVPPKAALAKRKTVEELDAASAMSANSDYADTQQLRAGTLHRQPTFWSYSLTMKKR
jgi:hypothetical protein